MSSFAKYSKVPQLISLDQKDSSNFYCYPTIIKISIKLGQTLPLDRPEPRRLDLHLIAKTGPKVVEEPTINKRTSNGHVINRHRQKWPHQLHIIPRLMHGRIKTIHRGTYPISIQDDRFR